MDVSFGKRFVRSAKGFEKGKKSNKNRLLKLSCYTSNNNKKCLPASVEIHIDKIVAHPECGLSFRSIKLVAPVAMIEIQTLSYKYRISGLLKVILSGMQEINYLLWVKPGSTDILWGHQYKTAQPHNGPLVRKYTCLQRSQYPLVRYDNFAEGMTVNTATITANPIDNTT